MTRDEALELIERLPFITTFKLPRENARMAVYEASVESDDPLDWVKVIKSSYVRERTKPGTTVPLDKKELRLVERAKQRLEAELASALSIPESEIDDFIDSHLRREGLL
jgi:CarD family transcriptional regulator